MDSKLEAPWIWSMCRCSWGAVSATQQLCFEWLYYLTGRAWWRRFYPCVVSQARSRIGSCVCRWCSSGIAWWYSRRHHTSMGCSIQSKMVSSMLISAIRATNLGVSLSLELESGSLRGMCVADVLLHHTILWSRIRSPHVGESWRVLRFTPPIHSKQNVRNLNHLFCGVNFAHTK